MATFNPYNKAVKESINVDYKDRHSAQKVILCNRENKFFGEFVGIAKFNDIDVTGGQLANVNLSNVSIYAADGRVLHLSSLAEDLEKVVVDFPEISALARKNEDDIKTISAHNKNVGDLINEISAFIVDETFQRQYSDDNLSALIVAERSERRQEDQAIHNKINENWIQHNQDLVTLSDNVIDEVENIKHYSMVVPKSEPIDKFMLSDWAVNKIKHDIPYAYVNIQQEGGDYEKLPAGRITDVVYTPEKSISGFTFVVPQNCPVIELGASDVEKYYKFTTNNKSVSTDYFNYSLTWNPNSPEDFKMTLNSGGQISCLSLAYNDEYVGRITEYAHVGADITSGNVFIQTLHNTELSIFNNIKTKLNAGESYTKEIDEYSLTVTLSSNGVKLQKAYQDSQYQNLSNTLGGDSIGKVFRKDGVTYDDDKTVTSLPITLPDNSICVLNKDNDFTCFLDENHDTAIRFNPTNDQISVRNEDITYSTPVFRYDKVSETSERVGTLTFDVPNIETIPAPRLSSFTLSIPDGKLSGTYTLRQDDDVSSMYRYGDETSSSILRFEYDTYTFKNYIRFTHVEKDSAVVVRGRFQLDPTQLEKEDKSETVKLATLSRNSEGWLDYPDTDGVQEFILTADVDKPSFIPGGKNFQTQVVNEGQPKLYIHIPSKLPDATRAREFIIAVNVTTQSPKPVMVIPVWDADIDNPTESPYKFIMNDMDVTNGLFLAKNRAVWKFMELEERCFVVEDLANTNLIHYINERLRGGVAYRGTAQVVDDADAGAVTKTPYLSNLFYYPESMPLPRGWDYPRPEYRNENLTLFTGNMFFVGKTEYTQTTRWEIEGVELEYGDYIVLKNDKKICEITSSDIDVIDTIEKDHIIVDDITVKNEAVITQISASTEYAENIVVDVLSAKNVTLSNLTADNEFVNNLTGGNVSVETLDSKTAGISSLTATEISVTKITADNLSVAPIVFKTEESNTVSILTGISETNGIVSVGAEPLTEKMVDNLCADLSTAYDKIHKKVWIDNRIQGVQEYSDISVVTLPKDEYESLAPNWDPRTLYVVSSDYINAYGGFIKNVKDGVDDQDAMNVRQVRQVSVDLTTVISSTSSYIDTNLSGLSSEFMDLNWNYNKTLSASQVPSGSENWPNCLILRDYAEDAPYKDKKYVLKVLSGMLTITELTDTTPIF